LEETKYPVLHFTKSVIFGFYMLLTQLAVSS